MLNQETEIKKNKDKEKDLNKTYYPSTKRYDEDGDEIFNKNIESVPLTKVKL